MGIECGPDGGDTTLNSSPQRKRNTTRRVVFVVSGSRGRCSFRSTSEQAVAACGTWTADDTFAAKVCFCETPHCVTLRLGRRILVFGDQRRRLWADQTTATDGTRDSVGLRPPLNAGMCQHRLCAAVRVPRPRHSNSIIALTTPSR